MTETCYIALIRKHLLTDYQGMYREPGAPMAHPFLTPGSKSYDDVLWDWDSWLSNVALRQVLLEAGSEEERRRALPYERGCVLNFLDRGVANYLTFRGLVRYGFDRDAKELAEKTIRLFGRDLERFGALHEYYRKTASRFSIADFRIGTTLSST